MGNSRINMLVIDDDDINIFIIKKVIEKTGYEVDMISKSNGQLAVDYLTSIANNVEIFPHIILVDINMPVLNGWEFLEVYEKLNIQRQKVFLYMLSSSVYEYDIEKAKGFKSVDGFISKPLTIERLKELLQLVVP
ncbi:response regulator [Pedobacter panaciterrae]|jgi:FOG: CheY-like receiver|uniref:Response regulator n=1 Tax=Pedobacter panaciterrae TaxID=363849 RepID=A0ABU8NU58_9SPHI|nr:response regulator [Pedobacter panaciterrae]NQX52343.1 response regulator [Pedobacter panaciterrae]